MMFEISSNLLHEMKLWPILWTYGQSTSGEFRFVTFLSKTVPFVSANNMIGLFRLLPITSTDCSRHMGVTHGGAREALQYLQKKSDNFSSIFAKLFFWQFPYNICKIKLFFQYAQLLYNISATCHILELSFVTFGSNVYFVKSHMTWKLKKRTSGLESKVLLAEQTLQTFALFFISETFGWVPSPSYCTIEIFQWPWQLFLQGKYHSLHLQLLNSTLNFYKYLWNSI